VTETIYSDEPKKNGFQLISASEKGDVETLKDRTTPLAHAKNKNFTDIVKILENAGAKL
jgi:hypothetical protein